MNSAVTQILIKRLPHWLLNVSGEIALLLLIIFSCGSEQKMLTAWAVYLLGAVCLMRVWWIITKRIPFFYLRQFLRLIQAALLLIPVPVTGIDYLSWSPAFVTAVVEGFFEEGGEWTRAGVPMLVITGMVIVTYIVFELLWILVLRSRWSRHLQSKQSENQQLADREELLTQSRKQSAQA